MCVCPSLLLAEVVKTRLMLARKAHNPMLACTTHTAAPVSSGLVATFRTILQQEGLGAFSRGVHASAIRGLTFGGIRLGAYEPVKDIISLLAATPTASGSAAASTGPSPHYHQQQGNLAHTHVQLTCGQKLLAGAISGGIGAVVTTPLELVKTRCQAASSAPRAAAGPMAVVREVLQQQGVQGLWRGATPSVVRSTLLNASMCATYDQARGWVSDTTGWARGSLANSLAASMASGLVTTTVVNPVDVVRAAMQASPRLKPAGDSCALRLPGTAAVVHNIWQQQGPGAFMKGWSAAYLRTGPQCVIVFLVLEWVRPLFGVTRNN